MARGGHRAGAGRKPGSANKKPREMADRAAARGLTPLEYMLAVLRDPKADKDRRDEMARASAPYLHARLAPRDEPVSLKPLIGSLADHGKQVMRAVCDGRLTPAQGVSIMQTLAAQARIVEVDDLERRIKALEDHNNATARS